MKGRLAAAVLVLFMPGCANASEPASAPTVLPTDGGASGPIAVVTATPDPASGVTVEFWEPAQPGWVIVLDTTLDNDMAAVDRAQLLLVDPIAGEVRGRITTGYHPHAALSPDGSTLYVAVGYTRPRATEGVLAAIETASGTLKWSTPTSPLQTGVPSRVRQLEVSADGSLVYLVVHGDGISRGTAVSPRRMDDG